MVGLIVAFACFIALADGLQNWSGLVMYGIAALAIFLSMQPWRSFLELDHHGFRVVWGAQSTIVRWCDVTGLRPAQQHCGRYGGVAFTAEVRPRRLLGLFRPRRGGVISGTIDARLYGISDGQLFQLMTHLRAGGDHRMAHASAHAPSRLGESRSIGAARPQASARQMVDRVF